MTNEKKAKAINWTALATAIMTAAGGGVYTQIQAGAEDKLKTEVAAEFAANHVWRGSATEDIKELKVEVRYLREAFIKLQSSIEHIPRLRAAHRELVELREFMGSHVVGRAARVATAPARPAPAMVLEQRALMFDLPELEEEE